MMKNDYKQITKKQHWVPQFYLKQFSNERGFLQILDLEKRFVASPRPYGSVCYDKFFYGVKTGVQDEISQELEDYFREIEDKAINIVKEFLDKVKNNKEIDDDLLYSMSFFMSSLWMRSMYFRQQMNRMSEDVYKKITQMNASHNDFVKITKERLEADGLDVAEETIIETQKILSSGEFSVDFSNVHHLRFLPEIEKFTNLFFNKYWRIYIAPEGSRFITSDTPIVEWFPERAGFYGSSFLERKHYFPISPEVLIELVYPISGKKIRRNTVSNYDVFKYNIIRAEYSWKFCYSGRRFELDTMVRVAEASNPLLQFI